MVVPTATDTGLLKEHAIYEFGYRREFDIYDFDYHMVQDQFVQETCRIRELLLVIMMMSLMSMLFLMMKPSLTRKHRPKRLPVDDLESAPGLSYSQTPTPAGSPCLSRDALNLDVYLFDEIRSKQY
jgi:hypothetical protein